jgi:hypothetical protein
MLLSLIDDPDRAPKQRFLPTVLTTRWSCGCVGTAVDEGGGVETETVLSIA